MLNVKIDTKEKFTVITPKEVHLTVNMTEELCNLLLRFMQNGIPHVVLNMQDVAAIDDSSGERISDTQKQFYSKDCSFVICGLQEEIETMLTKKGLLETMNVTPSESEAWDIVQMEEIERELLRGDE